MKLNQKVPAKSRSSFYKTPGNTPCCGTTTTNDEGQLAVWVERLWNNLMRKFYCVLLCFVCFCVWREFNFFQRQAVSLLSVILSSYQSSACNERTL